MSPALARCVTEPRYAITRGGWNRIGQATANLEQ